MSDETDMKTEWKSAKNPTKAAEEAIEPNFSANKNGYPAENGIKKKIQARIAASLNAYRVLGNIRRAVIGLRFS